MKRPDLNARLLDDPAATVLELLREAGVAMTAADIKAKARSRGGAAIDTLWKKVQPAVRRHPNVHFDQGAWTYRWADEPLGPESSGGHTPSADEALAMLVKGGVRGAVRRGTLGDIVREGLVGEGVNDNQRVLGEELDKARADLVKTREQVTSLEMQLDALKAERDTVDESPQQEYERAAKRRATRERHARIDSIRALVELAVIVEEMASIGADPATMIEYARSLADTHGLEPIERAGEQATFDPSRHAPNGETPKVGSPVLVIRPGYMWNAPGEAVLMSKALVVGV